jgi:hypothetical protein
MPAMNRRVDTVIKNLRGEIILIASMNDTTVFRPDGSATKYRTGENIQLVCGTVWNPTMSIGQNPAVVLSVCEFCRSPGASWFNRRPPTHGLCSRAAGSTCAGCGAFMCPSHAKRCRDGVYRCKRCRSRHAVRSLLTALFFKSEG